MSKYSSDFSDYYNEPTEDSSSRNSSDWQKKSLQGFSIPKRENKKDERSPEKRKSLADTINEKLLTMASSEQNSSKSGGYGDQGGGYSDKSGGYGDKKKSFSCGKKRTFEEVSSCQSWAKKYDKTIPDDIMLLCSLDR